MQPANVTFFPAPAELRSWLRKNGAGSSELWIGFCKKKSGKPSVTYSEALDEALCFGWIDGVRKRLDASAFTIRFTPRRPASQWSAVNIKRADALIAQKRMRPAGLNAFAGARKQPRSYSYEQRSTAKLDAASEKQFRAHRKAWEFFQAQAPWYRRTSSWWVISARKEETRHRRLAQLIADSAAGRGIGLLRDKVRVPKP